MSNVLKPEPLTKERFEAFGEVIELDRHKDIKAINYGQTERFNNMANLDLNQNRGQPLFNIFRSKPIDFPFQVEVVERHPFSSQLFYPLSSVPFLILVANSVDKPDYSDLALFITNGKQGINYASNTWHHYLLAIKNRCDFVVVDQGSTVKNCEEYYFDRPIIIENI